MTPKKSRNPKLSFEYDPIGDVLYISNGSKADYESSCHDGVVFRKDTKTEDVIGITVLYFKERREKNSLGLVMKQICANFRANGDYISKQMAKIK